MAGRVAPLGVVVDGRQYVFLPESSLIAKVSESD